MRTRLQPLIHPIHPRPTIRGTLVLVGVLIGLSLGCAKPSLRPDPIPAATIDLEPRCEIPVPGLPALEDSTEPDGSTAEPSHPFAMDGMLPAGARWFVDPGSGSGLATLRWGFRAMRESSLSALDSKLDLAAALLRTGETASDPDGFRSRILSFGGHLTTRIEEGWLWLELRYPETRREEALRLFFEWRDVKPVDPAALARIGREVALARLATESLPGAIAREAFRRVHPPPPGAARGRTRRRERPDWTAEEMNSFLASTLRPDASFVVYSGSLDSRTTEWVRHRFESEIERIVAGKREESTGGRTRVHPEATRPGPPMGPTAKSSGPGPAIQIVDRPGAVQVEILVGHSTVAPHDDEFPALETLASLLGGNVGGRLFRDLRERQGLAYIIDAEQSREGRFVVTTRARPERVVALLQGIEAHLRSLVELPLEPCEIRMLRSRMLGEEALLADDPDARAARIRSDIALLGEPRSPSRARRFQLDAIGSGLEAVARRHLAGRPTLVLVGDADWLERDLSKAFPERSLRILNERLEPIRFVSPSGGASSGAN